MTFTADGKMKRVPVGTGASGEGTWKLSKDGFCTTWEGAKASCFTVVSAGDNKWSVLQGLDRHGDLEQVDRLPEQCSARRTSKLDDGIRPWARLLHGTQ